MRKAEKYPHLVLPLLPSWPSFSAHLARTCRNIGDTIVDAYKITKLITAICTGTLFFNDHGRKSRKYTRMQWHPCIHTVFPFPKYCYLIGSWHLVPMHIRANDIYTLNLCRFQDSNAPLLPTLAFISSCYCSLVERNDPVINVDLYVNWSDFFFLSSFLFLFQLDFVFNSHMYTVSYHFYDRSSAFL